MGWTNRRESVRKEPNIKVSFIHEKFNILNGSIRVTKDDKGKILRRNFDLDAFKNFESMIKECCFNHGVVVESMVVGIVLHSNHWWRR